MKGGHLLYKCRKCGNVQEGFHVPDVRTALISIAHTGEYGRELGTFIAYPTELHDCPRDRGGWGIADLIGGREEL